MALTREAQALVDKLHDGFPDLGGTVTDAREARAAMALRDRVPFTRPPVDHVEDTVLARDDGSNLPLRLYSPASPDFIIVYLHGGGWVFGGLDEYEGLARRLCRGTNALVVAVAYRHAPEHPYPAALDDAAAGLSWASAMHPDMPVIVLGDSAGGNLAAALALRTRNSSTVPPLSLQVLAYPALDATCSSEGYTEPERHGALTPRQMRWYWAQYAAPAQHGSPFVSPAAARTLAGLPPAIVLVAENDPLHHEGVKYAESLTADGVQVELLDIPDSFHGFLRYADQLPAAADALGGLAVSIRSALFAQPRK